ncbi:MAG: tyrosine--tRNA ligase [Nanoarchaeota archaeon]|nr:tyrosine--tRNA ligase [Nanoarchaeota archaeon]MBU4308277.1 tyrosine--tRNA ligase [Nanoarchaeota archaeon]
MDIKKRVELIKDFAEEIVNEKELEELFKSKKEIIAYDGFEPSGIAPIHFGLLRATNLKNMLKAGIKFKLYLADYFGFINNKLGGDLKNIQIAGKYFIEVWKACGIDVKNVEIIWASELMDSVKYWDRVLRVAKVTSVNRTKKSLTIAGRSEGDVISTAQMFYPSMQVADIFEMDIDICQLGMDQRRANMLARDVATKFKWKKPVAVHHHILLGLQGLQKKGNKEETMMASKMSKSDPKTCIYMHDTLEEVKEKMKKAYCPEKEVEGNPVLEYFKYIIFRNVKKVIISRPEKFGGNVNYYSYSELEEDFIKGKLHPVDLKQSCAVELNKLITPVREYFEKNKQAKELYTFVKNLKTTK